METRLSIAPRYASFHPWTNTPPAPLPGRGVVRARAGQQGHDDERRGERPPGARRTSGPSPSHDVHHGVASTVPCAEGAAVAPLEESTASPRGGDPPPSPRSAPR